MMNLIEDRWLEDKSKLPLSESQKNIYFNAQNTHYHANGCFFDIQSPKTLNDKIQWTKFFDQQKDTITCTDKILVKDFVKKITGKDYFAKVLWEGDNLISFSKNDLPTKFVLKTNNDSGTTFLVKDKNNYYCRLLQLN